MDSSLISSFQMARFEALEARILRKEHIIFCGELQYGGRENQPEVFELSAQPPASVFVIVNLYHPPVLQTAGKTAEAL
ncbi:MAG: hypothetical protein RR821_13095 [Clostridia bacterium]